MTLLRPEPLTAEGFSGFGSVISTRPGMPRTSFDDALSSEAGRAPSLSVVWREHHAAPELSLEQFERHPWTSQTLLPLDCSRWLVIVAPGNSDDRPDMARVRPFIAHGGQGVTFRQGVWHHPLVVLDRIASFAAFMWCDGRTDDQFVPVAPGHSVYLGA